MLKFNNDHIVTGYIKQLLASFNLPTYKVYTVNTEYINWVNEELKKQESGIEPYVKITNYDGIIKTVKSEKNKYAVDLKYIPYIKNSTIQYAIASNSNKITNTNTAYYWENTNKAYIYEMYAPNFTKNLKITNAIYDSYTHEYLGDYLRFKRDYLGLDLMPLYNCFSNRICNALNYSFKLDMTTRAGDTKEVDVKFNTSDNQYKIYMIPVKLFKSYTIAIDSNTPVELCCGIYGRYQDERKKLENIPKLTYVKYNNTYFSKPLLYTKLFDLPNIIQDASEIEVAENEKDLKLFIKLPITNTSSIVILEGDYRGWNDTIYKHFNSNTYFSRKTNHFVTNFEGPIGNKEIPLESGYTRHIGYQEGQYFKPITPLQLLRANTRYNYPFADRLIEYLVGNTIDSDDKIGDNIYRIQKVLLDGKNESYKNKGIWESKLRPILYNYFNDEKDGANNDKLDARLNTNDTNHDILGYVDKDIEKYYTIKKDKKVYSLSDIDIYPDIYNDAKEK